VTVRIGVAGAGWWATRAHMPAIVANPDAVLAAIAEPYADRLASAAALFDVSATFATASEMLDATELDAVVIAAPHAYHHPIALDALERGLHVLVEKPMVLDPTHGRELVALARGRSLELVVGYPYNFTAHARALRELLADGRIGPIEHLTCLFASIVREFYRGNPEAYREVFEFTDRAPQPSTYSDPVLAGGGQAVTQITHSAALLLYITGLEARRVSAFTNNFELDVDLVDAACVEFTNGALATIAATGSVTPLHPELLEYRIFGADGHVLYDPNAGTTRIHLADGSVDELAPLPAEERYPENAPLDHFVEVVLGRAENDSPGELGLAVVELIDAIYRSAAGGSTIEIGAAS
jgi:predicted dehydrogenase